MVFEQSYSIKIKVVGKSTMQMEMFEEMLRSIVKAYSYKSNVKIILTDSKGNDVVDGTYSFARYSNGYPYPENKTECVQTLSLVQTLSQDTNR
jgi:hypothetical protein